VEDFLTAGAVVVFKVARCVLTFNKLAVVGTCFSVEDIIDKGDDDGNGEVFGISVELGSLFVSLMLEVADVLISLDGVLVSKVFRVLSVIVISCSVDDNAKGVVEMTLLICESILSAFASIISRPARIKSKKLLSVVEGRDLKGGRVDDETVVVGTSFVTSSSFGSSDPNNNEKKSIVSLSSSTSSSSSCRDCRLNFNERRRQS
jgi:hypothetical protein